MKLAIDELIEIAYKIDSWKLQTKTDTDKLDLRHSKPDDIKKCVYIRNLFLGRYDNIWINVLRTQMISVSFAGEENHRCSYDASGIGRDFKGKIVFAAYNSKEYQNYIRRLFKRIERNN